MQNAGHVFLEISSDILLSKIIEIGVRIIKELQKIKKV